MKTGRMSMNRLIDTLIQLVKILTIIARDHRHPLVYRTDGGLEEVEGWVSMQVEDLNH